MPLDQARLRPHLRDRADLERTQADVLRDELDRAVSEGKDVTAPRARGNDGVMVDPRDLRGLPALAPGVTGVQPGTQPKRAFFAKLARQERRRR
jgi:hypothetical protein